MARAQPPRGTWRCVARCLAHLPGPTPDPLVHRRASVRLRAVPAQGAASLQRTGCGEVMGSTPSGITRRGLLGGALALGGSRGDRASARGTLYAQSDVTRKLQPPLTLGMARVVLRTGALSQSATQGVRLIAVESGVIAVGMPRNDHLPLTAADLSVTPGAQTDLVELIMDTGTSLVADDPGVMSLRNPGAGAAVILDVVVYRQPARPFARAFTSDDVSFQLLASAIAATAPANGARVRLERRWLGPQQVLTQEAGTGVMVGYLARGAVEVAGEAGAVATARAATAAPYSLPGALQVLGEGRERLVTAGGMVFVPEDGAATVTNTERREAELLILALLAA